MPPGTTPLFDALSVAADEPATEAAAAELAAEARDRATCRETLLMLAEDLRNRAGHEDGARAMALRWAAARLRAPV